MSPNDRKADPSAEAANLKAAKAPAEKASPDAAKAKSPVGKPAAETVEQLASRLTEENAALKDQLLRQAAEFSNFRKRLSKDKEEGIRYANAMLLADVIPIIDDFERAIQSGGESKDFASFHSGVSLIERQLVSILERNWGLRRFAAKTGADGEVFDPEKHEAIAVEETADQDKPVVLQNYQNGYYLHDRVLRPAKVKVAKPIPSVKDGKKE
jgi:molecular chaperone GrpE